MLLSSSVNTLPFASLSKLLAAKMWHLRRTKVIIVASSPASVPIAKELAAHLDVIWDKQYCKAVEHPGNPKATIGSITSDKVLIHDEAIRIHQGYIEHQVQMMKRLVAGSGTVEATLFKGETFVIVRREISKTDEVLALVESLRRNDPGEILIATPEISRDARHELEAHVDRIISLSHHTDRRHSRISKMHTSPNVTKNP